MGDNHHQQRKLIESEMDRFEKEISSLAPPPPTTSFIPAQLRRPAQPQLAPPGTVPISAPQHRAAHSAPKPSPIIISGAPQVYSSSPKVSITKPSTKVTPASAVGNTNKPSSSSTASDPVPNLANPNHSMPTTTASSASATAAGSPSVTPSTASAPGPSSIPDPNAKPSTSSGVSPEKKKKKKKKKQDGVEKKPKKVIRSAGGQIWEDTTLQDWDPSDFRLFCGDLGNDVTDEVLTRVFGRYPSFQKAKVVRDKRSNKTKGFGFVSFKDPNDFVRAIKELDGRYVGSRPIKLRKSNWRNRNLDQARKREKERTSLLALIKK